MPNKALFKRSSGYFFKAEMKKTSCPNSLPNKSCPRAVGEFFLRHVIRYEAARFPCLALASTSQWLFHHLHREQKEGVQAVGVALNQQNKRGPLSYTCMQCRPVWRFLYAFNICIVFSTTLSVVKQRLCLALSCVFLTLNVFFCFFYKLPWQEAG